MSLVPDVPIPRISIAISSPDKTARIIENTILRPMRNQLLQLSNLEDMHSSARNGSAFIEILLRSGSNTDLAFIEVNEKVDQAMQFLPRNTERPRVVKSNIADMPVFYLSITPSNQEDADILELSEFAEKVIKRRLEQLNEIAFADLHGLGIPEIVVIPKSAQLQALNLTEDNLAAAIQENNIDIGNVILREGQYQYNVEMGNRLESIEDLKATLINIKGQIYSLSALADVVLRPKEQRSAYQLDQKQGIILSVRKKANANNFDLQESIKTLVADFENSYKQLDFKVINDQSSLLEISYQNLKSSLGYGVLFSCLILFLFFREWRLPFLIILTVPLGLILTLLGFYIMGLSINIISLSGIILGVGLMIDNAIIIIDNIRQEHAKMPLESAITKGTSEVIKPLISSALTTCSVFLPLILLSGIAGALFYDQAMSICLALTASLMVSTLYLPVMARLLFRKEYVKKPEGWFHRFHHGFIEGVLKWKWPLLILFLLVSVTGFFLLQKLERSSFPEITTNAIEAKIDWNENISITENADRIASLKSAFADEIEFISAVLGEKQFLLIEEESSVNEAELFVQLKPEVAASDVIGKMKSHMDRLFPVAVSDFVPGKNTFDHLIDNNLSPLIAYLQSSENLEIPAPEEMAPIFNSLQSYDNLYALPATDDYLVLSIKEDVLSNYGLTLPIVTNKVRTMFNAHSVSLLRLADRFIPILIGKKTEEDFTKLVNEEFVKNINDKYIPIRELIELKKASYYKKIEATIAGESIIAPLSYYDEKKMESLKTSILSDGKYFVSFGGGYLKTKELIAQLIQIILVVFILLYLILAAQFESFIQPIIVLIDVPLSMVGSLLFLYLGHATLNLVSMVGLIVMTGIIVNDAILKVDMINRYRSEGMTLDMAIVEGSSRRLRAIVMTSLTTILAFLPVLFSSGIGAEIQRPLALAVIGGLVIGTLSSLIFLPVLYRLGAIKEKNNALKQEIRV